MEDQSKPGSKDPPEDKDQRIAELQAEVELLRRQVQEQEQEGGQPEDGAQPAPNPPQHVEVDESVFVIPRTRAIVVGVIMAFVVLAAIIFITMVLVKGFDSAARKATEMYTPGEEDSQPVEDRADPAGVPAPPAPPPSGPRAPGL